MVLKGSLAFMQHSVNWWIGGFVFWCHEQVIGRENYLVEKKTGVSCLHESQGTQVNQIWCEKRLSTEKLSLFLVSFCLQLLQKISHLLMAQKSSNLFIVSWINEFWIIFCSKRIFVGVSNRTKNVGIPVHFLSKNTIFFFFKNQVS